MECISLQYSDRFFFSVLYNIAELLTGFWFYASHNFGCLVSLVSLLKSRFFFSMPLFMLFSQNLGSNFWFLVTYMDAV